MFFSPTPPFTSEHLLPSPHICSLPRPYLLILLWALIPQEFNDYYWKQKSAVLRHSLLDATSTAHPCIPISAPGTVWGLPDYTGGRNGVSCSATSISAIPHCVWPSAETFQLESLPPPSQRFQTWFLSPHPRLPSGRSRILTALKKSLPSQLCPRLSDFSPWEPLLHVPWVYFSRSWDPPLP